MLYTRQSCIVWLMIIKPHTYTYSCTNQVHIQRCTSFNIVHHPQASPCKIRSAGSPFQISAAVASQLHLNLFNVLKLQGLTKHKINVQQGPRSKVESIMLQNLLIMLFGISPIFCLLCSFLCFLGMHYADNLYL